MEEIILIDLFCLRNKLYKNIDVFIKGEVLKYCVFVRDKNIYIYIYIYIMYTTLS